MGTVVHDVEYVRDTIENMFGLSGREVQINFEKDSVNISNITLIGDICEVTNGDYIGITGILKDIDKDNMATLEINDGEEIKVEMSALKGI